MKEQQFYVNVLQRIFTSENDGWQPWLHTPLYVFTSVYLNPVGYCVGLIVGRKVSIVVMSRSCGVILYSLLIMIVVALAVLYCY